MSKIKSVQAKLPEEYFSHLSESVEDSQNYVRILDTPSVWGKEFGKDIMPRARARQEEFARAIVEMVQRSVYRCDLSSLNAPDPDWTRVILGAMDTALSNDNVEEQPPTQFRFLFGQTPLYPVNPPPNYVDFKSALIRLVRMRQNSWKRKPEIWVGRFYRLAKGIQSGLISKYSPAIISSDDSSDETKMTWNHTKIIAVDGAEALVGGHNLNMDLFRSYPPVHDVSVVVHGEAAHGAQQFLNQMWECKTDLLNKEFLDLDQLSWKGRDEDTLNDPLEEKNTDATAYMGQRRQELTKIHNSVQEQKANKNSGKKVNQVRQKKKRVATNSAPKTNQDIRLQDLQTLTELEEIVFPEKVFYKEYDQLEEYEPTDRIFSVGKYWKGENREDDYQKASEIMKEELIKGAEHSIKMSQMDLISAWKKNWSDHVVCHWLIDALYSNANHQNADPNFKVQIVVSPLDAGAGAEGDQYSFGSGAGRTFDLIKYYMTHKINDEEYEDIAARTAALRKLHIAPLYFTDKFSNNAFAGKQKSEIIEGGIYKWPDLTEEGYTQTIQQPPLFTPIPPRGKKLPKKGVIGSAAISVFKASPFYSGPTVKSAPGNHAKIMIVDDELYVVGSDNLYPGFLSEFNFLIEGKQAVDKLIDSYWDPLWEYSEPYDVNKNGQRSQTD